MVLGLPTMLSWLERRFEGRQAATGTRTVTSLALAPRAWPGFAKLLVAAGRTVTGRAG